MIFITCPLWRPRVISQHVSRLCFVTRYTGCNIHIGAKLYSSGRAKVFFSVATNFGLKTIVMFYKNLKGAASIPTDDLVPTIRHVRKPHTLAFQAPLLILTFTRAASSPRILEIGILLHIFSFLLLKVQTVWVSIHH